nr:hypothetical protein CFP56_24729 [Quercus suber]
MEGAPLSSNEGIRPWLDRHGSKVVDCVGKCPSPSYGHGELEGDGWGGNVFGLKEERGAGMVEMDRRMSTVVEKEREASVEQKQLMKKVKDLMEKVRDAKLKRRLYH